MTSKHVDDFIVVLHVGMSILSTTLHIDERVPTALLQLAMAADTRFRGENKPKLPLPKPPPPNPLAHNRQPKVRFSVAADAPTLQSGGSSYQLPGESPPTGCL